MQVAAVWGANGYIGKHLVAELLNKGYKVKALVRDVNSLPDHLSNQVEIHYIDFNSSVSEISTVLLGVQLIYCCAGSTKPEEYSEIYVRASERVILSAVSCHVERVILLSTVGVYGEPNIKLISIDSLTNPKTSYAKARIDIENVMKTIATCSPIQLCVVRIPMVVGAGMTSNALRSLLNSSLCGFYLLPGSKSSILNCIGINRVTSLLVGIANVSLVNGVHVMQFADNVKWKEILELYADSAKKRMTVMYFPKIFLKFISLITHADSAIARVIRILSNKAEYQDNSDSFLKAKHGNNQTLEDIATYINSDVLNNHKKIFQKNN